MRSAVCFGIRCEPSQHAPECRHIRRHMLQAILHNKFRTINHALCVAAGRRVVTVSATAIHRASIILAIMSITTHAVGQIILPSIIEPYAHTFLQHTKSHAARYDDDGVALFSLNLSLYRASSGSLIKTSAREPDTERS